MLSSFLATAAGAGLAVQFGVIVAATLVLEDAATVIVGMMAADETIPVAVALAALYVGIAGGDLGLYGLGNLASRNHWARRLVPFESYERSQHWLRRRLIVAVATSRFVPGTRLPVYTACGFLRMPLGHFSAAVAVATIVWTTLLFSASYAFGSWAAAEIGIWRWPAGLAAAGLVILAGHIAAHRRASPGKAL